MAKEDRNLDEEYVVVSVFMTVADKEAIEKAAGGTDKVDDFMTLAALHEASRIEGLDDLYLNEYVKTDKGSLT
jgi:hypothetical protein